MVFAMKYPFLLAKSLPGKGLSAISILGFEYVGRMQRSVGYKYSGHETSHSIAGFDQVNCPGQLDTSIY